MTPTPTLAARGIDIGYSAMRFYAWCKDGCGESASYAALTSAFDAGKAHVCPNPMKPEETP